MTHPPTAAVPSREQLLHNLYEAVGGVIQVHRKGGQPDAILGELCPRGGSATQPATQPFCDGTHQRNGFTAC